MWLPVVIFLGVCILLAAIRVFLGPTATDRLVAFDVGSSFVQVAMVYIARATNAVILIDVAIVYALLSFAGTMYVAKYLEKSNF